jgi:hypothetical protein
MWVFLLLGVSHAYLATTGIINVSTQLASFTAPLKVVFFDFDRTLTVGSTSPFLALCDPNCALYAPAVACTCNQTTKELGDFLVDHFASRVLGEPDIFLNGTDRRNRLQLTMAFLKSENVQLKMLSTSWYHQSADNWQYFIHKVLTLAGLAQYFPLANILTLADPGENIAADKGSVMQKFLASKGWTKQNGLFVDDSEGNIASANGKVDWLFSFPRTGLAQNQLEWIESRARQTFVCPKPALTRFLAHCTNTDFTNMCRAQCALAASILSAELGEMKSLPLFVASCIRRPGTNKRTFRGKTSPLSAVNIDFVVAQLQAGNSICK